MAKIIFEKEQCIGCGACTVICPNYWEMGEDRIAVLKGGAEVEGKIELEVEEVACNKDAEQGCPVQCIKVNEK